MFAASTHDHLLLFTDKGRVYYKKVFELPEGARTAKGRAVVNVLELQDGEQVVAMLPFKEFREDTSVFFATQSGTVKKTELSAFENVRQSGIKAITIDEGDRLVGAALVTKADDVLLDVARRASRCGSPRSASARWAATPPASAASRCAKATACVGMCTFAARRPRPR